MYSFYRFENAPFTMKNVEKETFFRQCDEIVDISDTTRAYFQYPSALLISNLFSDLI